jgi:hypothetical protein
MFLTTMRGPIVEQCLILHLFMRNARPVSVNRAYRKPKTGGRSVQACATVAVLQLLSAAAAIVAAGFWLWSALTSVPKRLKPSPEPV